MHNALIKSLPTKFRIIDVNLIILDLAIFKTINNERKHDVIGL